jgi:hypothetical protein
MPDKGERRHCDGKTTQQIQEIGVNAITTHWENRRTVLEATNTCNSNHPTVHLSNKGHLGSSGAAFAVSRLNIISGEGP